MLIKWSNRFEVCSRVISAVYPVACCVFFSVSHILYILTQTWEIVVCKLAGCANISLYGLLSKPCEDWQSMK
jgi:hypothetical protein